MILLILLLLFLALKYWPQKSSELMVEKIKTIEPPKKVVVKKDTIVASEKEEIAPAVEPNEKKATKPEVLAQIGKYQIKPGDNLWELAKTNYQNGYYWPNIYRVNNDITNPDLLEPDQMINIPSFQGHDGVLTLKDKKDLIEGYEAVVQAYKNLNSTKVHEYENVLKEYRASVK